jgi:hypothetical protein
MLFQVQRWAPTPINALAPLQLYSLANNYALNILIGQIESMNELLVEHLDIVSGDCPHCQFGLEGYAELANYNHVQWGVKSARDFCRNRNPTAREP